MDKRTTFEHRQHDIAAIPNAKVVVKEVAGAFLTLFLFLLLVETVLIPEVLELYTSAILSQTLITWAAFAGSTFLSGLLIAFPAVLIIRGIACYRDAHALDKLGVLTEGSITEKRLDTSNGRFIYYVRYKYFRDWTALQTVTDDVFRRLACGQSVEVLQLEHAPHISRLVLNSLY
ncbi:MAG TPA: hypothetical protein VHP14_15795 [Anaerolineales bacterium]|nr:hypothetical protein [Anaerolineales bacterium]